MKKNTINYGTNETCDINSFKNREYKTEDLKEISLLYTEDHDQTRENLSAIFRKLFKEVFTAKDGQEGLEIFKENSENIDLVITDLNMPNLNGLSMGKQIKEIKNDTKIIACSGNSESKILKSAIDIGFNGYEFKPINIKKFITEKIKDVINDILTKKDLINVNKKLKEKELELKEQKYKEGTLHEKIFNKLQSDHIKLSKENTKLNHEKKLVNDLLEVLDEEALRSETDLDGNITFANDKLCEITGYSKDEIIGKPHGIIRHKDVPDKVYETMWSEIKKGNKFSYRSLKNKGKNGNDYFVDTWIMPMYKDINNPDRISGYQAIRYNVTENILLKNDKSQLRDGVKNLVQDKNKEIKSKDELLSANREVVNVLIDILRSMGIPKKHFKFHRDYMNLTNTQELIKRLGEELGESEKRNIEEKEEYDRILKGRQDIIEKQKGLLSEKGEKGLFNENEKLKSIVTSLEEETREIKKKYSEYVKKIKDGIKEKEEKIKQNEKKIKEYEEEIKILKNNNNNFNRTYEELKKKNGQLIDDLKKDRDKRKELYKEEFGSN